MTTVSSEPGKVLASFSAVMQESSQFAWSDCQSSPSHLKALKVQNEPIREERSSLPYPLIARSLRVFCAFDEANSTFSLTNRRFDANLKVHLDDLSTLSST